MSKAQTRASLSYGLAQHGAGALLYLPASKDGSGYYVAAWAVEEPSEDYDAAPTMKSGVRIGLYGAPPISVATPAGRVYLTPDLAPQGLRDTMAAAGAEWSDDAQDTDDVESVADDSAAEPGSESRTRE